MSEEQIIHILGKPHLFPRNSASLTIDVRDLAFDNNSLLEKFCKFTKIHNAFDFVVMDPPWPNQSAIRCKSYEVLGGQDLRRALLDLTLPITKNGLVAIWVTNDPRYKSFVLRKLFPKWGCKYITSWFWVKMALSNQPVISFGMKHRKPFETLLIGRKESQFSLNPSLPSEKSMKYYTFRETTNTNSDTNVKIPHHRVFFSNPVANRHSCKPPPDLLFQNYLPKDALCLEVFARDLRPNFLSLGIEPLKFAQMDYFEDAKHRKDLTHK